MPAKRPKNSTPVDSIRHADTRKNIPTEELRDFVAREESEPYNVLYPRDPSLDPQLVWTGKDKQDREDLAVPVVPVYIQEKIHPRALIEDLLDAYRRTKGASGDSAAEDNAPYGAEQLDFADMLFADFNGLPEEFDQRVDFYQHDGHWSNRMILGDSLLVMTSLAEKEGLKGKVQCIYLDPPYGIKFGSNWQVSTRKRDVKDGKAEDATRQPEQVRAFRDTWKLGIHSYLAYLRDRLMVARDLLTETGSIFVQIGDENVHLVRCVMDEVFGSENTVAQIAFKKTSSSGHEELNLVCDYLLWYAKEKAGAKVRPILLPKTPDMVRSAGYNFAEEPNGRRRPASPSEKEGERGPGIRLFTKGDLTSERPAGEGDVREFDHKGRTFTPGMGTFKSDRVGLQRLEAASRIETSGSVLRYVRYWDDFAAYAMDNFWPDTVSSTGGEKVYVVQTGSKIIQRCVLMTTDPGDLVLDPTCGSGTTAYVAEQWGRRWITCDTSRVALALARTRLMAAKYPYYKLVDSDQCPVDSEQKTGHSPLSTNHKPLSPSHFPDIKKGFVYRRVPHVTGSCQGF